MALPAFKALGAAASGSGSATATSPTLAAGDVCLGFVVAESNPATPSGWTLCDGCPVQSGVRFYNVYWQRAASAGTLTLRITASGSVGAQIAAYSGCVASGDPTEAGTGQANAASTTVNIPAITTLGANRLVVLSAFCAFPQTSNISNATLAALATRTSAAIITIGDGSLATAGSSGASSYTVGGSVPSDAHAIALKPAGGTASNTITGTATLPAIGAAGTVAMAATMAAVASLSPVSASGSVAQANAIVASSALAPVQASGDIAQANPARADATLPSVRAIGTAVQTNPMHADASLPDPQASGTLSATNTITATANLPEIYLTATIQQTNVNPIVGTITLPAITARGTITASNAVDGAATLPAIAADAMLAARNPVLGTVALPTITATGTLSALNALQGTAELPAIQCVGTITFQVTYAPDPRYYALIAARSFYASTPARSFYAAMPARSFYILSDPDMTPTFDTKDPRETVVLTFDATADLAAGETLTTIEEVDITLLRGVAGSAAVDITDPVVNDAALNITVNNQPITIAIGQAVQAVATAGISGCTYLIAITCNTSNPDKVLTLKATLPVSAQ